MVLTNENMEMPTTETIAQEGKEINRKSNASVNVSKENYQSGLQETEERGYTNLVDPQILQTSGLVIKVEICDEDYENIQGPLSNDDTVRLTACVQSVEESNNYERTVQKSIQALDDSSVNSRAKSEERNALLLQYKESMSIISGNQNFSETTSNQPNHDQDDPEFISEREHRARNVHSTVDKSHTCSTFIRKDNLLFQTQTHTTKEPFPRDCNLVFSSDCQFNDHLLLHREMQTHRREVYFCTACNLPFSGKRKLVIRLNMLQHTKLYSDCCNGLFPRKYSSNRDPSVHNEYKPYHCEICSRNFSRKDKLIEHIRVHTGYKSYRCKTCLVPFSCKGKLDSHAREHTCHNSYRCEICSRHFSRKDSLRRHEDIHAGYKRYCCNICSRRFSHKHALQNHVNIHTGYKPYLCEICSRPFRSKENLRRHVSVHTGYKPYRCKICSRRFSQKEGLQKHVNVHTGYKPYRCDICLREFSRKDSLCQHIRVHR